MYGEKTECDARAHPFYFLGDDTFAVIKQKLFESDPCMSGCQGLTFSVKGKRGNDDMI